MKFSITDDTKAPATGDISDEGVTVNGNGGTEQMLQNLKERVNSSLLDEVNIICSRVRAVDSERPNLLWLHDLWNDPEATHLQQEESRDRFAKTLFVSNWQMFGYNAFLGVPYKNSLVMRNAIDPFETVKKSKDVIRIIYHTTPHRGLELLWPIYKSLYEIHGDSIHLDVFSSFEAYGWKERDSEYTQLFDYLSEHEGITYHGYQPNEVVREALKEAHIFAYPSIWPETSCISVMEAMSAGCAVICPNLAALPETTGGLATMYQWSEDSHEHMNMHASILDYLVRNFWEDGHQEKLAYVKNYADNMYNWDSRGPEWEGLLNSVIKNHKG